ncbi:MAG: Gfo/Idh/MocA family oxidoreductase, partial [Flavobacteriaceae bacterium]|nr:Gfo/Idh/MocA family oxidoreductase [Flavobacteriaceae bacterium]
KECDAMIHAATKAGVKLMVGHVMRFAPGYSYARKFIEEGYLGNIFCLRSTLRHSGPYKYWGAMSKWFFDRRKSGGGVLTDLGPHMIDISRYLLKDEIESVTGILGSFEKDGAERDAIVILKFKKPVFSEISVSWSTSPLIVKTEIFGSEGSIIIDNFGGQLSLCSKKDKLFKNNWINVSIISESGFFVAFQREINHFIDCILHDKKPLVDGQDGKKTVEVIEKVYKFNKSD